MKLFLFFASTILATLASTSGFNTEHTVSTNPPALVCPALKAPLCGDFNNDGYLDIAYYGKCGNGANDCWRVHLNNKNGGFHNAGNWGGDMWFKDSYNESKPVVGDFNKDGYADIAYYGKCGNGADCWRVHLNNKNGGFHNAGNWGGDMWFRGIKPVHIPLAGDFNNDGYTDIAYYGSCGSGKECWRVHINNKNGSFSNAGDWGADMWFKNSEFESTPIVGDFNKDGFSDIAYYGKCGNGADCWRVHINNKIGGFNNAGNWGADMWFQGSESVNIPMAADFNNDGFSDIAYFGKGGNGAECWRVHINNKIGGFNNAGNWGADMWFEGSQPKNTPMAGDLNKDGFADIVYFGKCGNSTDDCWRVHVNNKIGGFLQYAGNWGGDMWFGDCGDMECKDVSVSIPNQVAGTYNKAKKKAIEEWEKKVKQDYGADWADWSNASKKDIIGNTQNGKSAVYCFGIPCRKSPTW